MTPFFYRNDPVEPYGELFQAGERARRFEPSEAGEFFRNGEFIGFIRASGKGGCDRTGGILKPKDTNLGAPKLRDEATGAFLGNHQTHLGAAPAAADCIKCHKM